MTESETETEGQDRKTQKERLAENQTLKKKKPTT